MKHGRTTLFTWSKETIILAASTFLGAPTAVKIWIGQLDGARHGATCLVARHLRGGDSIIDAWLVAQIICKLPRMDQQLLFMGCGKDSASKLRGILLN